MTTGTAFAKVNLIERFFNKIKHIGVSRPDTTNSRPTIWHSSGSHQSALGYVLMSRHPSTIGLDSDQSFVNCDQFFGLIVPKIRV